MALKSRVEIDGELSEISDIGTLAEVVDIQTVAAVEELQKLVLLETLQTVQNVESATVDSITDSIDIADINDSISVSNISDAKADTVSVSNAADAKADPIEKRGSKVEAQVSDNETVSVPSGKVWEVTVSIDSGEASISIGGGGGTRLNAEESRVSSFVELTLHEGASVTGVGNTYPDGLVTGWEVDY